MALTKVTSGMRTLATDEVLTANINDDAVTTAKVPDNAVTLAKMAGLARGKIIVGDSSGDPSALTVGSANQVLTSDGTDATWAAASGTTINNNADNRIITGSGTANTLEAESQLQYGTTYGYTNLEVQRGSMVGYNLGAVADESTVDCSVDPVEGAFVVIATGGQGTCYGNHVANGAVAIAATAGSVVTWSTSDTDGTVYLSSSGSPHHMELKNRSGGTKTFHCLFFA